MKKKIAIVISAIVLMVVFAVFASALLLGDADNDGKVKAGDARRILRHAAKIELIENETALRLSDVDGDGKIKASDARLALRMASRIDPTREYGEVPGEDATTGFVPDVPTLPTDPTDAPTIPTDPATTEVPADPATTESPVYLTTEVPADPMTTESPVYPTTEVPADPTTTEVPADPTTEVPAEPTTGVPVEPTTEAPVEPTTEAPVEPTTEAPVEPTTGVPVEPTTDVDLEGVEFHDTFYIDADIINYAGGYEDKQSVKIAFNKEEQKAKLGNKTYTLYSQYICTDAFMPGHEVGVLIRDDVNLLGGTEKSFYIINYESNEYLVMNASLFETMGADVDELFADNPMAEMALPTFTDLAALHATEEEYEGKVYQVVTLGKADGYSKYYVEQHEDGQYYPVIAESYVDGQIVSKMVIRTFDTDPHEYTNVPTGMKAYQIRTLTILTDLTAAMPFFERLGVM